MALGMFLKVRYDVVGRPYLRFCDRCVDVVMFWK
jgi:hypothetical protein